MRVPVTVQIEYREATWFKGSGPTRSGSKVHLIVNGVALCEGQKRWLTGGNYSLMRRTSEDYAVNGCGRCAEKTDVW